MKRWESRFYKYRVPIANLYVLLGLITACLDPFSNITLANLLIGFIVALMGVALRVWASSYVWQNIASDSPMAQTGLITAGTYAYLRNPIYVGAILLVSGLNIGIGSPLAVITMLVPTILTHYWQIKYEELYLLSQFGERYLDYKQNVRRVFPKLWGGYKYRWGKLDVKHGVKNDIGPLSGFIIFFILVLTLYLQNRSMTPFTVAILLPISVLLSVIVVFCVKKFL